jgi:hypothetical protein
MVINMHKTAILGITIIAVVALSGCLSINTPGNGTAASPSPQVNVTQIVGTWHGENNLTYTFNSDGTVLVVDDATVNDYDNYTHGTGHWHYIGRYVVDIDGASGRIDNVTEFHKIFGSIVDIYIENDSGRSYFYDNRTPSMRYYKTS